MAGKILIISIVVTILPTLIPSIAKKTGGLSMKKIAILLAVFIFLGLFVVGVFNYHNDPRAIDTLGLGFMLFDYFINGMIFAVTWTLIAMTVLALALIVASIVISAIVGALIIAFDKMAKP